MPRVCPTLQIPLAVANPPDACSALTGVARGSVIVVRPGKCGALPKSRNVIDAGAIGMIVVDQDGDGLTQPFNPVGPGQDKPLVNFPVSAIFWRHGDWIFGNASGSASMTLTRKLVRDWGVVRRTGDLLPLVYARQLGQRGKGIQGKAVDPLVPY